MKHSKAETSGTQSLINWAICVAVALPGIFRTMYLFQTCPNPSAQNFTPMESYLEGAKWMLTTDSDQICRMMILHPFWYLSWLYLWYCGFLFYLVGVFYVKNVSLMDLYWPLFPLLAALFFKFHP
jgi:hypothetical protein